MTLTNLFMPQVSNTEPKVAVKKQSVPPMLGIEPPKFESYMKQAETVDRKDEPKRETEKPKETDKISDKEKVKDAEKTDETKKPDKAEKPEESEKPEEAKPEDAKDVSESGDETEEDTDEVGEEADQLVSQVLAGLFAAKTEEVPKAQTEAEAELTAKISAELAVPEEKINGILEELGITALELEEPEKLSAFLQKLTESETPAEMLTKPETLPMLETVQKAIGEVKQEFGVKGAFAEHDFSEQMPGDAPSIRESAKAQNETGAQTNTQTGSNQTREQDAGSDVTKNVKADMPEAILQSRGEMPRQEFNFLTNTNVISQPVVRQAANAAVAQSAARVSAEEIVTQIASRMSVEVRGDVSEVKMMLKPESLGEVQMKVTTQNGIVTAQFVAESQRVKEAIEAGFQNLRDMLAQQGINVSELSVSVGNEGQDSAAFARRQFESRQRGSVYSRTAVGGIGAAEDAEGIGTVSRASVLGSSVDYSV